MIRWCLAVCGMSVLIGFLASVPSSALSLKLQPLSYTSSLAEGEKKQGFIDISNPSSSTLRLKTSIQAFRQTDDAGNLAFYDDPQVTAGITPDLSEFDLGPRQVMRMYFLLDGTKLPAGDVFGALLINTVGEQAADTTQQIQLGTLFMLTNGATPARNAEITNLKANFFQFGKQIEGTYAIKNTDDSQKKTGFTPRVNLKLSPWGAEKQVTSSLIFAGNTRTNQFILGEHTLGFYMLSAQYGNSKKDQWVFVATGVWQFVILGVAVALGVILILGTVHVYKFRNKLKKIIKNLLR